MNLDYSPERFLKLLTTASEFLTNFYQQLPNKKIFPGKSRAEIRTSLAENLPEYATEPEQLLAKDIPYIFDLSTLNLKPEFFGLVVSGGTQIGALAEMLAGALNQNAAKWHIAPAATEMEQLVVKWIGQFIGFSPEAAGVLVSGGSAANLTGLMVARRKALGPQLMEEGLWNRRPLTLYASSETHSCVDKSIDMLGIGCKYLRKIPVIKDSTIDIGALIEQINQDIRHGFQPFCVIGNAGTVNTGVVDPLDKLADICEEYKLWLHVDGAYGGPAAGVEMTRSLFAGIERADSVALDPHKWLQVPFEAGCLLVRNAQYLKEAFSYVPTYLNTRSAAGGGFDLFEHRFQLSSNFKALKVWLTFKAYGAEGLRSVIEDNINSVRVLEKLITEAPDFELVSSATLSILCFRYVPTDWHDEEQLSELNRKIVAAIEQEGKFFLGTTMINMKVSIRICNVNHRTTDATMDALLEHIRDIAASLIK